MTRAVLILGLVAGSLVLVKSSRGGQRLSRR